MSDYIVYVEDPLEIIEVGTQGPQGPQGASGSSGTITEVSGSFSIDTGAQTYFASGTGTGSLPTLASAVLASSRIVVKNVGVGTITIDGNGSELIEGALTLVLSAGQSVTLVPRGSTQWERETAGSSFTDLSGSLSSSQDYAVGTPGTYTKVTTDAKGRVSSGTSAAFSDLSGNASIAQGGTNNPSLGVSALGIYAGDGSKVVQVTGSASQQFRVNAGGTAIEAFTPSASGVTSVATDATLTGGPITSTGTLGIASSAALPGSPTTTTQASTDNSTKVATTAHVASNRGALPYPWAVTDMNRTVLCHSGGVFFPDPGNKFVLFAAGIANGGDTTDNFPFVYKPITGDFTFSACVRGQSPVTTNQYQGAGLRCAETSTSGSKHFTAWVECSNNSPTSGLSAFFIQRTSTNGANSNVASASSLSGPVWIRLVRSGTSISTYRSANGSSWTQIGTTQTLSLTDPVVIGFVGAAGYTSAVDHVAAFAHFSDVTLSQP